MEINEYEIMYTFENAYWWYRGLHELVEKYIRRYMEGASAPLVILDAGCGTGKMMNRAQRYGTVEGIDYSQEALRYCIKRGLKDVLLQDLNTWDPPLAKYDIILCLDVLYHRDVKDEGEILRKFHCALKPNGLLIENLPAFELLRRRHDKAIFTKRRYRQKRVVKALREKGFTIVVASYRLPWLFVVMLVRKIVEFFFTPTKVRSDLFPLPRWLNGLLLLYHRIENVFIYLGVSMPLGGSLFIIGRKKNKEKSSLMRAFMEKKLFIFNRGPLAGRRGTAFPHY